MYIPKHFEEARTEVLHELIRRHPLGVLVVKTPEGLDANHIPFEIDAAVGPHGLLKCHVARANPVWRHLTADADVLVIFQGEDSYVSPAWYPTKQDHGKVVPTWNYVAVHAYGRPRVEHDAAWLRALVESLTNTHERGRADPWQVSDAPHDYIEKMLAAIVGIEIPIERIIGKWKVSQNRSADDRRGVTTGLNETRDPANAEMAQAIERTL